MSTQTVTVKILTSFQRPDMINGDDTPKCMRTDDMPFIEVEYIAQVSFKVGSYHDEDDYGRVISMPEIQNFCIDKCVMQVGTHFLKNSTTSDWLEIENPNHTISNDLENLFIEQVQEIIFEGKDEAEYPLMPATKIAVYNPQFEAAA